MMALQILASLKQDVKRKNMKTLGDRITNIKLTEGIIN